MYTPTNEYETTPPLPRQFIASRGTKSTGRRSRLNTPEHAEMLHESQHFFRDSGTSWAEGSSSWTIAPV
ncbi:hypothetical protein ANCCAN_06554 [Ancylostoma caninum]|uniref:Uncharacterized protein n=1 Tax=Ancylostoma caninum TaxID=29170 RepID=A0A368GVQ0_ANCCA|nr:hypothetical protein ANCCAN_06554 [Ancylostoma caninum]